MGLQRVGTTELLTLNSVLIDHQGALWTTFCADAGFLYSSLPHVYTSGSVAKKNLPVMQETQVPSLGQKDTLEKEMATRSPTLVFFPGKPHRQKSLADYTVRGVTKVRHDLATKQQ